MALTNYRLADEWTHYLAHEWSLDGSVHFAVADETPQLLLDFIIEDFSLLI